MTTTARMLIALATSISVALPMALSPHAARSATTVPPMIAVPEGLTPFHAAVDYVYFKTAAANGAGRRGS